LSSISYIGCLKAPTPRHWTTTAIPEQGGARRQFGFSKPNQGPPNKSKQKRLDLFGFIRANRDFSMGYVDSN
jgi:hypothetical protein